MRKVSTSLARVVIPSFWLSIHPRRNQGRYRRGSSSWCGPGQSPARFAPLSFYLLVVTSVTAIAAKASTTSLAVCGPVRSGEGLRQVSRREILGLQRRLARGVAGAGQVAGCGLPVGQRVLVVGGRAVGGQVRVCGLGLRCVVCGPRFWGSVVGRALFWGGRHAGLGGGFGMSVLTLRHGRRDSLADLLLVVRAAWARLRDRRTVRRAVLGAGVGGCALPVVVLHVTWSPVSGWHPHLHVLWFGAESELAGLGAVVGAAWRDAVVAESVKAGFGERLRPSRAHGGVFSPVAGLQHWETLWQNYLPEGDPEHPSACTSSVHVKADCWLCQDRAADEAGVFDAPDWGGGGSGGGVWDRVAPAAVVGCPVALGVLKQFLVESGNQRRVVWPVSLGARLGKFEPPAGRGREELTSGGVFLSRGLAFRLEVRRGRDGGQVDAGFARLRVGDEHGAARVWSEMFGREVEFDVADGRPLMSLEGVE